LRGNKLELGSAFVIVALVFTVCEVFFSSLFGDGLSDFGKHNHLAMISLLMLYVLFIGDIIPLYMRRQL
jgi:hypothetical protein